MTEKLSAEAQALVDEGMELATLFGEAYESMNRSKNSRELDRRIAKSSDAAFALRAHLERMAAMAAPQGEPVASIYIDMNGQREIDDWMTELPAGQTILYTAPQATAPAVPADVERDAARYRWLRNQSLRFSQVGSLSPYAVQGQTMNPIEERELDAAIDAMLAAAPEMKPFDGVGADAEARIYCYSLDEENYSGDFESREDALAEATAELEGSDAPGETRIVWTGVQRTAMHFLRKSARQIGIDFAEHIDEWLADNIASEDSIVEIADHATFGVKLLALLERHAKFNRWAVAEVQEHEAIVP